MHLFPWMMLHRRIPLLWQLLHWIATMRIRRLISRWFIMMRKKIKLTWFNWRLISLIFERTKNQTFWCLSIFVYSFLFAGFLKRINSNHFKDDFLHTEAETPSFSTTVTFYVTIRQIIVTFCQELIRTSLLSFAATTLTCSWSFALSNSRR